MTANNNIRLSTTEEKLGDDALWCFESRAGERAKDKDGEWIAMRSYTSAHSLGIVANAVRALPSYASDSCLLLHRKQMMTDKQEADMRKVANWFGDAKSKVVDYPECHLTEEQVLAYQRDGYLHIEGLLPPEAVARARAKIQEGLDRNIDKLKTWYSDQAWTAEYTQSPDVLNLMAGTPLFKTCEALFGTVCPLIPPTECQIALRRYTAEGKDFGVQLPWHIDAYDKITTARFGIIVFCSLSDWEQEDMGNYTVYPGSHVLLAKKHEELSWVEFGKFVGRHDLTAEYGIPRVQCRANAAMSFSRTHKEMRA